MRNIHPALALLLVILGVGALLFAYYAVVRDDWNGGADRMDRETREWLEEYEERKRQLENE